MLDARDQLQSLKRGLEVLRLLNLQKWATISEVANRFELPRTTAQRILRTLVEEGYVARDMKTKRYSLTPLVCALSAGFDEEAWVVNVAVPILRGLTKEISWPVLLAVPFGERMLVRAATDHDTPMAIDRFHVGASIPMAIAPTGYVFLAFCDPNTRAQTLSMLAKSDDPRQHIARKTELLERQFRAIRKQGYVLWTFENEPTLREAGVAVPVMVNDRVFGGILMRYVKKALTEQQIRENYVPRLQEVARDIATAVKRMLVDDPKSFVRFKTFYSPVADFPAE